MHQDIICDWSLTGTKEMAKRGGKLRRVICSLLSLSGTKRLRFTNASVWDSVACAS